MNKNKIRLTESQLHKLVKNSLKSFINEGGNLTWKDEDGRMHTNSKDNWYGIEGATFVWHGEWSDAEIYFDYNGEQYVINATDAEDWLWNDFKEYCEENNLNPDEHSDDEIWYNFAKNDGYDALLNLGPYNESYTMNESKYINKNKIRLTESQLHRVIRESVKQALSELDWKTYANAANKRQAQGNWQSADSLRNQMVNSFNDKYATSDSEYNNYNGISTNKSASFQMDNGSMGDQGALKFKSQISQSNGEIPQYINRNYRTGLEKDMYNQLPSQGQWHGQHGMTDADKNAKQQPTWSSKVRDKAMQGVHDVDRYHNGQSKYVKGKGWQ